MKKIFIIILMVCILSTSIYGETDEKENRQYHQLVARELLGFTVFYLGELLLPHSTRMFCLGLDTQGAAEFQEKTLESIQNTIENDFDFNQLIQKCLEEYQYNPSRNQWKGVLKLNNTDLALSLHSINYDMSLIEDQNTIRINYTLTDRYDFENKPLPSLKVLRNQGLNWLLNQMGYMLQKYAIIIPYAIELKGEMRSHIE